MPLPCNCKILTETIAESPLDIMGNEIEELGGVTPWEKLMTASILSKVLEEEFKNWIFKSITLPKELTPVSTSLDEYILFTLKPRSPSLIIDLEICPWTKPDLFA